MKVSDLIPLLKPGSVFWVVARNTVGLDCGICEVIVESDVKIKHSSGMVPFDSFILDQEVDQIYCHVFLSAGVLTGTIGKEVVEANVNASSEIFIRTKASMDELNSIIEKRKSQSEVNHNA